MRTFIINWYGPYDFDEVSYDRDFGNGLYLITGKQKYQRESKILYCGITEGSFYSRFKRHHKKDLVSRDQYFWLGELQYPVEFTRSDLEAAEKIIVYFWVPNLNQQKIKAPPTKTTLLNFWFTKDRTPRINQQRIYRDLPDVISWDEGNWRTGNLSVWQEEY